MKINSITLQDIQKGTHEENRMVIIQCKDCEDQKIGNHVDWIKGHLKKPQDCPLHRCQVCKVETKLKNTDIKKIKEVLELSI